MWKERRTFEELLEDCYGSAPGDRNGPRLLSPRRGDDAILRFTKGSLDYTVARDRKGYDVLVGLVTRDGRPDPSSSPAGWSLADLQAYNVGLFDWVDICTVLGDPDLPEDFRNVGFDTVLGALKAVEPRLDALFADHSCAALRRAQRNRAAENRAAWTAASESATFRAKPAPRSASGVALIALAAIMAAATAGVLLLQQAELRRLMSALLAHGS